MELFIQQLVSGISIGAIYSLLAVGYALVYSVYNFTNWAFDGFMAFGAFMAFTGDHLSLYAVLSCRALFNYSHCYSFGRHRKAGLQPTARTQSAAPFHDDLCHGCQSGNRQHHQLGLWRRLPQIPD